MMAATVVGGRELQLLKAHLVRLRAARVIGPHDGFSVADMASALIGSNEARRAAASPVTIRIFRNLHARLITGIESDWRLTDQVGETREFGEALAAILETAPVIEAAFRTIIFETLASAPGSSLGLGGAGATMRLTAQIHTGPYPAGAIRVDTNLNRRWGHDRLQHALEGVHETIFC